ncbi:MmcQ/YjbR family (MmcQ) (PDB:2A1V) (PUBMED:17266124) [Commensalibacter communis]|uniref:MmcQ/YjbR family (MmcQ) n=1 Tax=Commensalibacter communis TaxID=2972786 RepID=A0A9W4TPI1_9PROT|nr:MmcQ/YjbR family DNA-binding protein [Commensalibacter communis]CAI3923754.1 MmcQ/YjbR family (MmcQ) (PDB:2A1V) (PUBMED:17266124) [Commensalibacter communis]CAI3924280.1 MmcQ/YjbR family (MmcQ) (PDB:2A1V) (PUBMED:17266124) [Commensalibacter communis]CAI3936460.1 MmcQ/YjbR family (MmcQ) (PDB:2A1V) (PUBMED:17266124) [Commensalibacter communis]CAI3946069.1 MmcQ/YjbR family (MmcQ) (PDB:2A1V) (PUBMED:17266124) [Commensalibacter communis]CAI3946367.1 MmcQ/YjbR family (MmcQ) (PDB:2A1V) (PUBMED:172
MNRQNLFAHAKEHFGTIPDYPWIKFPDYAVLRHCKNRKWYGLLMNVSGIKLGLKSEDRIDILNVKVDPEYSYFLQQKPDIFPAYHMNREHWVSVLLNGNVSDDEIYLLLQQSFDLTG